MHPDGQQAYQKNEGSTTGSFLIDARLDADAHTAEGSGSLWPEAHAFSGWQGLSMPAFAPARHLK